MSLPIFGFFYLVVFAVATLFSSLGAGGGVLYTPVQLFFGIGFHVAAPTSLFLIIVMSISGTLVFHKAAVVDWPLAIALESATTLGAFLGGLFSGHFSGKSLVYLFSGVIAVAAFLMVKHFEIPTGAVKIQEVFSGGDEALETRNTAPISSRRCQYHLLSVQSAAWLVSQVASLRLK